MRNIRRIPLILDRLEILWKRYPDLRLGQLIGNVIDENIALYYIEDEDLINLLTKHYLGGIKK